jgi:hypothetical protein
VQLLRHFFGGAHFWWGEAPACSLISSGETDVCRHGALLGRIDRRAVVYHVSIATI